MPLWRVYHPESAFADTDSKRALVRIITSVYAAFGVPCFDVTICFLAVPSDNIWIGELPVAAIDLTQLARDRVYSPGEAAGAGSSSSSSISGEMPPFVRLIGEHHALLLTRGQVFEREFNQRLEPMIRAHLSRKSLLWEIFYDRLPTLETGAPTMGPVRHSTASSSMVAGQPSVSSSSSSFSFSMPPPPPPPPPPPRLPNLAPVDTTAGPNRYQNDVGQRHDEKGEGAGKSWRDVIS